MDLVSLACDSAMGSGHLESLSPKEIGVFIGRDMDSSQTKWLVSSDNQDTKRVHSMITVILFHYVKLVRKSEYF